MGERRRNPSAPEREVSCIAGKCFSWNSGKEYSKPAAFNTGGCGDRQRPTLSAITAERMGHPEVSNDLRVTHPPGAVCGEAISEWSLGDQGTESLW